MIGRTLGHYRVIAAREHLWQEALVPALLIICATLAVTSLLGDSLTFDETHHLAAGMSFWKMHDYRFAQATPPLAQRWMTLPLLFMRHRWPGAEGPGWQTGDMWEYGRAWLFHWNDGRPLLIAARLMIVLLLLATCLAIYAVARRLFGEPAGLLALALAALCPTLLAHGRLATVDLPFTLVATAFLLSVARALERPAIARLLAVGAALIALVLVKLSWPIVLVPAVVMVVVRHRHDRSGRPWAAVAGFAALLGLLAWLSIWAAYGFRYSPFRDRDPDARMFLVFWTPPTEQTPNAMEHVWRLVLRDEGGRPLEGIAPSLVRWAREHRLLPEAYLFAIAFWARSIRRVGYLAGELSNVGSLSYFPLAVAIKTPVATLLLFVAGLVAIVRGRVRSRDPVLLAGLVAFFVAYGGTAVLSPINIGHRHVLPLYPILLAVAGASAAWLGSRPGRVLVAAALAWLVGASLWIHPHYLSYFNELVGGPARGHLFLADSNIDWGQDLERLAAYARAHPQERLHLLYFGTADPTRYGFPCEVMAGPSAPPTPPEPTAGTYVVSITTLLAVYDFTAEDGFWATARNNQEYRKLYAELQAPLPELAGPREREQREAQRHTLGVVRRGRLLHALRHRPADARIGYSLWVYRLTQAEIDAITRPD